jgi:4-alpha-glucanotransferase
LVSPDDLAARGWLSESDLAEVPSFDDEAVEFDRVIAYKEDLLARAYERFRRDESAREGYERFCEAQGDWLGDYAVFMAAKEAHGLAPWTAWAPDLRRREPEALAAFEREHAAEIDRHRFFQFCFFAQWDALRDYARVRGVRFFGDLPIYVAHDSADVWAAPELFHLDGDGQPTLVAGVPPDYFSATGQRWGNPIYRWDVMAERGFAWWTRRFAAILRLVDSVRLDHFRGFEAFWAIPAGEETAVSGEWMCGPGAQLFEAVQKRLGPLPVVAENLGIITPEVTALMERFGYPGMAIFQFAFDTDERDPFLPHNYRTDLVAYTGTHDNDTLRGWWNGTPNTQDPEQVARSRAFARAYLGLSEAATEEDYATTYPLAYARALMASVATLVVFPAQDVLGLGSYARKNLPGSMGENGAGRTNWSWRMRPGALETDLLHRLAALTETYGRAA